MYKYVSFIGSVIRSDGLENLLEPVEEDVGVLLLEDEGWPQPEGAVAAHAAVDSLGVQPGVDRSAAEISTCSH